MELLVGGASALRLLINGLRSGRVIVDEEDRVISVAPRPPVVDENCDRWRDDDPLKVIADRLLSLVQGREEWWREAVRRWANDPPHYVDDQGFDEGVLPIPFPMRALTADERLGLLAAICDTYAEGVELIDPWRELRLLTLQEICKQGEFDNYLKGLRYRVLLDDRVPALREDSNRGRVAVLHFDAGLFLAPRGIENANAVLGRRVYLLLIRRESDRCVRSLDFGLPSPTRLVASKYQGHDFAARVSGEQCLPVRRECHRHGERAGVLDRVVLLPHWTRPLGRGGRLGFRRRICDCYRSC
jgi:hypothetical protein